MRSIYLFGFLLVLLGGLVVGLLLYFFRGATDADARRVDIIRTAGTLVVGGGGAAALLLAARRQRYVELKLEHDQREAQNANLDASYRRSNELFTKSIEQLGSDKSAVRLGAAFSLSRVAQAEPSLRGPAIEIFCSYLRTPFTPPISVWRRRRNESEAQREAGDQLPERQSPNNSIATSHLTEADEELSVRMAIQKLLISHTVEEFPETYDSSPSPNPSYWGLFDLDLSDALLLNLNVSGWHINSLDLSRTTIIGNFELSMSIIKTWMMVESVTCTDGFGFRSSFARDLELINSQFCDRVTIHGGEQEDTSPMIGIDNCAFTTLLIAGMDGGGPISVYDSSFSDAARLTSKIGTELVVRGCSGSVFLEDLELQGHLWAEGDTFGASGVFLSKGFDPADMEVPAEWTFQPHEDGRHEVKIESSTNSD